MTIKKIELNHIKKLASIFDDYRMFYNMTSDIYAAEQFLFERTINNESVIFVAENNMHEFVGFIQLYPIFSSTRMKRLWLLNDLFVAESQRGQGISVKLINEAKKLCTQTDACGLILETSKSNIIGNNLYPKAGFLIDLENNYYIWNKE